MEDEENCEEEEETEEKRRDEEEMQDSLMAEGGLMVHFPLVLSTYVSCSCFKVLSAKETINNHIIQVHKDPTSCIL